MIAAVKPEVAAEPDERELLDAYSRAVTTVVDDALPVIAGLRVQDRRGRPGGGSGFVVAPDGFIVTNSHVVSRARKLQVRLADGEDLAARVVGDDPLSDLALVRVEASQLPYLPLATPSPARPGQLAIALGAPHGFHSSVSTGVVSALGRSLPGRRGQSIDGVVQHTAALNPGNSGGPLLSSTGRLLGINTAVIWGSQGLGFAVSAETLHWVLPQLMARGRVQRSWIGIAAQTRKLGRRAIDRHGLTTTSGVEVLGVERGAPANKAGLRKGDTILAIDQHGTERIESLQRRLRDWSPGQPASLDVLRDDERLEIAVVPQEAAGSPTRAR